MVPTPTVLLIAYPQTPDETLYSPSASQVSIFIRLFVQFSQFPIFLFHWLPLSLCASFPLHGFFARCISFFFFSFGLLPPPYDQFFNLSYSPCENYVIRKQCIVCSLFLFVQTLSTQHIFVRFQIFPTISKYDPPPLIYSYMPLFVVVWACSDFRV